MLDRESIRKILRSDVCKAMKWKKISGRSKGRNRKTFCL